MTVPSTPGPSTPGPTPPGPSTPGPTPPGPSTPGPSIPVTDLPADAAMLDVREADEWVAGHSPTSRHLPMSELTTRIGEVPADDPLYVVCRSGARSARVVAYLAGQGFPAVNVEGGMQSWAAQGRPVVADGDRTPEIA